MPATAASSPSTPGAAAGPLSVISSRDVEAGVAPDGRTWLPKFAVRREDGDQGVGVLVADKACIDKGMHLCTEAQWTRACELEPALGSMQSWTLTISGETGFVVRGGAGGCTARELVAGSAVAPSRVGACCDRAVGIVSTNPTQGFRIAVAGKLGSYERGINRRQTSILEPFLDDQVTFFGKTYDRAMLLGRYQSAFSQEPDHWLAYDTCDVSIQNQTEDATWTADCATTVHRRGELARVVHQLVWSGEGKLRKLGETRIDRKFGVP